MPKQKKSNKEAKKPKKQSGDDLKKEKDPKRYDGSR
jgi:hypothetical protein